MSFSKSSPSNVLAALPPPAKPVEKARKYQPHFRQARLNAREKKLVLCISTSVESENRIVNVHIKYSD